MRSVFVMTAAATLGAASAVAAQTTYAAPGRHGRPTPNRRSASKLVSAYACRTRSSKVRRWF